MNDKIEKEVQILPPFKKFCMTIGELPSSYLETMTYYEMLVWFCNYLGKTVIPTIDNNAEAVIELQNLFVELQTYVNNYFDNLDVQEEINNKLDDMVEAGTLQEIIADYLNSKAVFGFDNVADMKEATNLIDGSYAKTLGYYTKNDGGSALYKIRNKTIDDTIDEINIIQIGSENLIGELIYNEIMNVKQFGAKGNNVDDDTSYINTAISKCNNIIFNKNETYLINNEININRSNINLNGNNCSINFTGSDKILFNLSGNIKNIKIYNFNSTGIITDNTASITQCFVGNHSNSNNNFENIEVLNNKCNNMTIGITFNANTEGHLKNIIVKNNYIYDIRVRGGGTGYGVHIADGQDEYVNGIIENNEIKSCASHCIYIARGNGFTIINNNIHDNRTEAEATGNVGPAVNLSRSKNILFQKNKLKNNWDGAIFFSSELNPDSSYPLESYPCENIIIDNNIIEGYTNLYSIFIGYGEASVGFSNNIKITNNTLIDTNTLAIFGVKDLVLSDNYFKELHNTSPVLVFSGTNETSSLYTHNLTFKNNIFEIIENQQRPIRLNNTILGKDAEILFQNNKVNVGKIITTQSNVGNSKIKIIDQYFDNDFYFNSGITFNPVYINGTQV